MTKLLEGARRAFMFSRTTGNTSCAVDACLIHGEAYLVVATQQHAQRVVQEYPDLKDRVIPVSSFERLYGLRAPLVWDSSAVEFLIENIYDDLKRQFEQITGFHAV